MMIVTTILGIAFLGLMLGLVYGLDPPAIDYLAELDIVRTDGACVVTDPRGTGRYAYVLLPTSATAWEFWRVDLFSRAKHRLTAPAFPAQTNVARARLLFDPSGGTFDTPMIWLIAPVGAAPFMTWQGYFVNTDTWNAYANIAGLAAPALAIDLSLAHACRLLGFGGGTAGVLDDNTIVCNGDGGVFGGAGFSNLACYNITTNTWALVTGFGGVRGGAPAIGSTLCWLPQLPDALLSFRGGGSNIIDLYDAATDAWNPFTPAPPKPHGEGCDAIAAFRYPFRMAVYDGDGEITVYDLTPLTAAVPAAPEIDLVCRIAGTNGAPHQGMPLFYWQQQHALFFGVMPHSRVEIQRIQVPVP